MPHTILFKTIDTGYNKPDIANIFPMADINNTRGNPKIRNAIPMTVDSILSEDDIFSWSPKENPYPNNSIEQAKFTIAILMVINTNLILLVFIFKLFSYNI